MSISKYERRKLTVEVFQLPDLADDKGGEGRRQLRDALAEFGFRKPYTFNQGLRRYAFPLVQGKGVAASPGDWLVKRASGRVEVVRADDFAEDYAPVKTKDKGDDT